MKSISPALWIVATAAVVAGLYFFRDTLTQFALALFLWLVIDGLTRALHEKGRIPGALALPIALILVLGFVALIALVIAGNMGVFIANAASYEARANALMAQVHDMARLGGAAPTLRQLVAEADLQRIATQVASGVQGMASDFMFILIYVGFLFSAAAIMPQKLDAIFPNPDDRAHTREVLASIRNSIDAYLYVQTVVSIIISALTYSTLRLIGLDNALFWCFLIFFLNYIPTIGSIFAVILPTAFAVVQFPDLARVAGVAAGVGVWQFVVGNFLQPRMTGESLNLSAVVVLLGLALWGTIWGIAGAFLSAPITVMLMIVFAQFPSTRWIAVLLSADARPPTFARAA